MVFALGGCVDQGIRPPDVHEHIYTMVPNMNRWVHRHSRNYRHEIAKYRRSWAQFYQFQIGPVSLSREILENRPRAPWLPNSTILMGRPCQPGMLPPPDWWRSEVEAYVVRAGLPVKSLQKWINKSRNMIEEVFRIDRAIRIGLTNAGLGATQAEQQPVEHHNDHPSCPAAIEGPQNRQRVPRDRLDLEISRFCQQEREKGRDATIRDLAEHTGYSVGTISKITAWRDERRQRDEDKQNRSVRTRSLSRNTLNTLGKTDDPSAAAEAKETLEEEIRKLLSKDLNEKEIELLLEKCPHDTSEILIVSRSKKGPAFKQIQLNVQLVSERSFAITSGEISRCSFPL